MESELLGGVARSLPTHLYRRVCTRTSASDPCSCQRTIQLLIQRGSWPLSSWTGVK